MHGLRVWEPTHIMEFENDYPWGLTYVMIVGDAAYTEEEWNGDMSPDIERDEHGNWLDQGLWPVATLTEVVSSAE